MEAETQVEEGWWRPSPPIGHDVVPGHLGVGAAQVGEGEGEGRGDLEETEGISG